MGNPFLQMSTPTFIFCICICWVVIWLFNSIRLADKAYWEHIQEQEKANKTFMDGEPLKLDEFEEHLS